MASSSAGDRSAVWFVVPGRLDTRTGGYEYDRRIIEGCRRLGWDVAVHELEGDFPFPSSGARCECGHFLSRLPDEAVVVVDGLAFGAVPDEVLAEAERLRFVALVHHPLARETGLDAAAASALEASERRALASARIVVVTSGATAESLRPYNVDGTRIVVIEPGTDPAALAEGARDGFVHLLAVGSIVPRKGYDVLADALASIPERNWRLTIVGSTERDPHAAVALRQQLRRHGLEALVRLAGDADATHIGAYYAAADLFVLATRHEGYGMAVAEALARGVPVVSTPTGGIPALVGDDAGILVPPDDAIRLGQALSRLLSDPAARANLAAGARRARARLRTWDAAAATFAAVLERIEGQGAV